MPQNPFRARNLSPGRLPYSFPPGHDIGQLVQQFRRQNYRGQILGAHGTGKTTLLCELRTELTKAGHRVTYLPLEPLSDTKTIRRRLPTLRRPDKSNAACRSILLVDGIGLLRWWTRRRLLRLAQRNGWGVLVTAHRDFGLPTLWKTNVTVDDAARIIPLIVGLEQDRIERHGLHRHGLNSDGVTMERRIEAGESTNNGTEWHEVPLDGKQSSVERGAHWTVPRELVARLLDQHGGDLREVLFSLYDWYDTQMRDR